MAWEYRLNSEHGTCEWCGVHVSPGGFWLDGTVAHLFETPGEPQEKLPQLCDRCEVWRILRKKKGLPPWEPTKENGKHAKRKH